MRNHVIMLAGVLFGTNLVLGDEIVQEGELTGEKGVTTHEIFLDQFDTLGGTRELNFVRLDFLTATIGGGQTSGTGVPVSISVLLSADYSLNEALLAETAAIIDTVIPNTGNPTSFSLFDNDFAEVVIDDVFGLAPWIGTGQIMLDAVVEFNIDVFPPDEISFSAGGSIDYTVTYNFDVLPAADAIPAVSEWGVVAMMLLTLSLGTVAFRRLAA